MIAPSASTDSIRLLETGRVNFAILDIHDLAIARERGANIVGILPIVERPLASVIAAPAVTTPRRLVGQTVGVSGAPSDTAVLDSIVAGAGGQPEAAEDDHDRLQRGQRPAGRQGGRRPRRSGTTRASRSTASGPGFHVFRVENYGAPSYPELVVCATAKSLQGRARRWPARSCGRSCAATTWPSPSRRSASARSSRRCPGSTTRSTRPSWPGSRAAFRGPEGHFGVLDPALLRRWAAWEARFGIVKTPPDVAQAFDTAFAPTARGAS